MWWTEPLFVAAVLRPPKGGLLASQDGPAGAAAAVAGATGRVEHVHDRGLRIPHADAGGAGHGHGHRGAVRKELRACGRLVMETRN